MEGKREKRLQYLMQKKQKHFGQIFGSKKWNIIRMQRGLEKLI